MARWVCRTAAGSSRVVPDVYWKTARSSGALAHLAARGIARQRGEQRVVGHDHVEALDAARGVRLLGVGDEDPRRAVLDAEAHAIGAEQREQRHRDGAPLDGAEEGGVEGQRGLEHDGHAVARRHAARGEEVGEPRRPLGQIAEADDLVAPVGVRDAHGHAARGGVPVHALVRDVERRAVAVEQLPERGRREVAVGVGVARVVGQSAHRGVGRRRRRCSAIRACKRVSIRRQVARRHRDLASSGRRRSKPGGLTVGEEAGGSGGRGEPSCGLKGARDAGPVPTIAAARQNRHHGAPRR